MLRLREIRAGVKIQAAFIFYQAVSFSVVLSDMNHLNPLKCA